MDSKTVNREIRAAIRPVLRSHGFSAFTERTGWRYSASRIDVINFQSFNDYLAASVGCTSYSFALNLGQYLRCVPPDDFAVKYRASQLAPQEWQCHLRLHLQRQMDQPEFPRRDIWYIDPEGQYLSDAVRDARRALLDTGLAWFDRYSSDETVLEFLTQADYIAPDSTDFGGALGSSARNLVHGYILAALGRREEALERLTAALARNLEISKSLYSPRSKFRPGKWERLARDVAQLRQAPEPAA
jgi:hypothetical protein